MGHSIFDREYHARRIAANHYRDQVRPWGLRLSLLKLDDNTPHLVTTGYAPGRYATKEEAEQQRTGPHDQVIGVHSCTQGKLGQRVWMTEYRLRHTERRGAPFREASMTWEYQEQERAATLNGLKRWKKESSGRYCKAEKPWRDIYHRKWRHAGRAICHHALRDLDDSHLHPQPDRLGIAWDII